MTAQRTLILKVINDSCEHLNAEQVYMAAKAQMPGIAMATVYNNLKYLSDNDYIRKIGVSDGADFYDRNIIPHDHAICDKCGRIADINPGGIKEALEKSIGSRVTHYDLNVHYVCPECKLR